jgi:hypothetical protein
MGSFDVQDYEIKKRLPEWWKDDLFLSVTNEYANDVIKETLKLLLPQLSIEQPWQVWKTLPEEYNWMHTYNNLDDDLLTTYEENPQCHGNLELGYIGSDENNNRKIIAKIPDTKRNCDGIININVGPIIDKTNNFNKSSYTMIKELVIKNENQKIIISNINTNTNIQISTKDNQITVNNAENHQISGYIDKIKPTQRDLDTLDLNILDENKKTELEIYTTYGEKCQLDLSIELLHPVYVTEQNIKVHSVSMFPIRSIKLFGYFCHPFNSKTGWVYLFEKTYAKNEKVVYDRITKQYDCEIFFIQIEYYGLAIPIEIGFPQEEGSSNPIFSTNTFLDYWGKILSISRRYYKTSIPQDEERLTYPSYYTYPIEQDYWYEQRLLNEYRINDNQFDYAFINDTDGNNMAVINTIDPYVENIYMFTETILPTSAIQQDTGAVLPNKIIATHKDDNAEWINSENLKYDSATFCEIILNSKSEESVTNVSYKSDVLSFYFEMPELPNNINIKGAEIKMKGATNLKINNLYVDDRSYFYIPKKIRVKDSTGNDTKIIWHDDNKIIIGGEFERWPIDNNSYTLGDKDTIFGLQDTISKDEVEKGTVDIYDGTKKPNNIRVDIGFTNDDQINDILIKLFSVKLTLFYEIIEDNLDVTTSVSERKLQKNDIETLTVKIKNNGNNKVANKKAFIVVPPEISIDNQLIDINLNSNEMSTQVVNITPKVQPDNTVSTGIFNILIICNDIIKTEEVIVL